MAVFLVDPATGAPLTVHDVINLTDYGLRSTGPERAQFVRLWKQFTVEKVVELLEARRMNCDTILEQLEPKYRDINRVVVKAVEKSPLDIAYESP